MSTGRYPLIQACLSCMFMACVCVTLMFFFHLATNDCTNDCNSCLDSILVNGKGELYCPGQKFLQSELAPGLVDDAFPPGTKVSDKG
jgi:hypothetical protein